MTAPPRLFDTHLHLDLLPEPPMRARQMQAARAAGVAGALLPGVVPADWPGLLAAAAAEPGCFAAPGVHPLAAKEWNEEVRRQLENLLSHPRVLAVGEIGLDGSPGMPPLEVQERAFRDQLALARAFAKPVLIHCRRATGRLLDLVEEVAIPSGGIVHAFGGSLETAHRLLDLGFLLGFGGALTYPNARRGPSVLQALPAAAIVLETDAPDLAPWPQVGAANRPEWLLLVARRVAELRGWSLAETARITGANTGRLLGLPAADPDHPLTGLDQQ